MNTALWITQAVLAAIFIMAGIMKSTNPIDKLAIKMPWVKDFSVSTVRLIGVSQFLAAIGLIVPWLSGIAPVLTPVAALGLALIMLLAAVYHLKKSEWKEVGANMILLLPMLFIAYGRLFYAPSCSGN